MSEEKNMVNEGLNILVFNNDEFGNIRTVILNNNPWFVGKDVAECLGYTNSKKAIRDHVDDEDKIMGGTKRYPIYNRQIRESSIPSVY